MDLPVFLNMVEQLVVYDFVCECVQARKVELSGRRS